MPDLPVILKLVIAAEILLSVLAAGFGTPPRRRDGRGWEVLFLLGAAGAAAAAVALHAAHHFLSLKLALAVGVECLCALTWLGRADRPDDDDDDGGGDGFGTPPPDWDGFDRARREWERPRVGR